MEEIRERGKKTQAERQLFTQLKYSFQEEMVQEKKVNAYRIRKDEDYVIEKNKRYAELKVKAGQDNYVERMAMADQGLRVRYDSMRELESVEMRQLHMLHQTQANQ